MARQILPEEQSRLEDEIVAQAPSGLSDEEFDRYFQPRMAQAMGIAEQSPRPLQGSALKRALGGMWQMVNPVTVAQGLYQTVRHPIETGQAMMAQSAEQWGKAKEAAGQGDYIQAAARTAATVPLIGPVAAGIGETIGAGDVAGGVGQAIGLVGPMALASPVAKGAARLLPEKTRTAMSGSLQRGAEQRIADVMSPKIGKGKVRFGTAAEEVAPAIAQDLVREGAPLTRQGLMLSVADKFAEATDALDRVADNRLAARTFETKPLIDALRKERLKLTAEAVEGSRLPPAIEGATKTARPIGENVVPAPNAPRVAMIDQAINDLRKLGLYARYEPIRRIRQSYDVPAKVTYNPAVTEDFLAKTGASQGAADVTGALRETLAKWDPDTAAANAPYALYRKAHDVLTATKEVERTRPRVGRQIAARIFGTVAGGQAQGPAGAVAGYLLAPVIDSAVHSGLTTQLKTARMMTQLAEAIRAGQVSRVYTLTDQLQRATRMTARIGARATGQVAQDAEPE